MKYKVEIAKMQKNKSIKLADEKRNFLEEVKEE
jgi:hypothetical protein